MLPSLLQSSAFSEIIVALLLSYISDFCIYFLFSCVKLICIFRNFARQSSLPRKRSRPFSAASAVLMVDGACRCWTKCAFHSVTTSFVTAALPSHAAKARMLRRYFSLVHGSPSCKSFFDSGGGHYTASSGLDADTSRTAEPKPECNSHFYCRTPKRKPADF